MKNCHSDKINGYRIAPSPTGYVHLGTVAMALANSYLARQNGGRFYLRIEDTDGKRYVADAVELYDIERKKQENVVSDLLYKRLIEKQLIRYFFPMFRGMSVEELSQDIYFAVLSTEAWFETSAGFKDEFDDMINGNGLFRGKSKRKMFD